jgi:hypothetical protein
MGLIFVEKQSLEITKGQPRIYGSTSTTQREFCERCGSPVFFERDTRPELIAVLVGSLDYPNAFSPQYHLCTSSAVGWLHLDDKLPRFEEKPQGMSPTVAYDSLTGQVTEAG